MKMHEIEIRTRLSETDMVGHINNVSYFIYLEEARIRFMEDILRKDNEDEKWNVIVASAKCDYIAQAYFNQTLKVRTYVEKVGNSSFTIKNDLICKETGQLIAKGTVVMVCFDFESQSSKPIPPIFRERLESCIVKQ